MRMRQRIATLLVASLSLSTSVIALSTPSPAGAVLPGVIDVAVTIDAKPSVVSPPGAYALYEVRASNVGLVNVSAAKVTLTLPSGSFYDDALSTAACSGAGATVTCPTGPMPAGSGAVRFDVVASTPTSAGIVTATATISAQDPVGEPLEYKANNTDTADVDVRATSGAGAFALVREGESLSLDVGDGRKYTLTVPAGVPGVIASIKPDDGTAKTCVDDGGAVEACGKGFVTDFVPHPYFKAEDPTNPLLTTKTFGPKDPCEGLGAPSGCYELFFAKSPLEPVLYEMAPCTTPGDAVPSPCMDGPPRRITGADGRKVVWFNVVMLSNDPLELPPLNLGR